MLPSGTYLAHLPATHRLISAFISDLASGSSRNNAALEQSTIKIRCCFTGGLGYSPESFENLRNNRETSKRVLEVLNLCNGSTSVSPAGGKTLNREDSANLRPNWNVPYYVAYVSFILGQLILLISDSRGLAKQPSNVIRSPPRETTVKRPLKSSRSPFASISIPFFFSR